LKWIFADGGDPGSRARWGLFIFLAVLLLSVPQAALLPLLDRDEPRFAEASREMRQSGHFVVPTFNGAPRYAKPPLIYWAQAASFRLLGENAWTARLPSLLATASTALILFAWGLELAGLHAGLIAALAYGLCFQAMQQGRVATADALLVFFTTLIGFAGWKLLALARAGGFFHRAWHGWGIVLALGFGGGFLAKGPEALLPVLPLFFFAWKVGLRVVLALKAIFYLGLLLVAAWAIPAYLQTQGAYWREGLGHDVGERMISGFQGHGASSLGGYLLSLPYYLILFWMSALPWSPLLVVRRQALFRGWRRDATDGYLLANATLYFVIFSLMVTKLPHYTLPAFPFLALLFARRWDESGLSVEGPVRTMLGFGLIFALLAWIAIPASLLIWGGPSPVGQLVQEAGSALTPATEFALVDFQEPNAIWEMRRVARAEGQVVDPNGAAAFLTAPGPRAIVLTTRAWREVRSTQKIDPACEIFSAQGWNAARLARLDLTLVVKPAR
jgi:4-amino-4-deoxy-L-arabinose transferase-like glycosyltransferase